MNDANSIVCCNGSKVVACKADDCCPENETDCPLSKQCTSEYDYNSYEGVGKFVNPKIKCQNPNFHEKSELGDFTPKAILNHPVGSTSLKVTVNYISVADVLVTGNFEAKIKEDHLKSPYPISYGGGCWDNPDIFRFKYEGAT